ncbi:MAG: dGTP triphosphohydrolase [Phycisphaerae bacterium]
MQPRNPAWKTDGLSPFAAVLAHVCQRQHAEEPDPLRTPFDLDRHRIIECMSFRRLEGKTQVFAPSASDHFRTRLTHTLEVSNIARCLADRLGMSSSLAEAIALAHDLGHPPFGHAGEKALRELMADHGGFNHNAHSVRVVDYLEHPFPSFRGLNLTEGTRAGLRDHETRYDKPTESEHAAQAASPMGPSVEAILASVADRVAYDCHDLEDAIGAGFIGFDELRDVALWQDASRDEQIQDLPIFAIRRLIIDRMMNRLLTDLIDETNRQLSAADSTTFHELHTAIGFTASVERKLLELEEFLLQRVYRHPEIVTSDANGQALIEALFAHYVSHAGDLPDRFRSRIDQQGEHRVACDFIAGMTDRFCRTQYEMHCTSTPTTTTTTTPRSTSRSDIGREVQQSPEASNVLSEPKGGQHDHG